MPLNFAKITCGWKAVCATVYGPIQKNSTISVNLVRHVWVESITKTEFCTNSIRGSNTSTFGLDNIWVKGSTLENTNLIQMNSIISGKVPDSSQFSEPCVGGMDALLK